MKFFFLLLNAALLINVTSLAQETTIYNSPYSFDQTVSRFDEVLTQKGFKNESFKIAEYVQKDGETKSRVETFEFSDPYIMNEIVSCEPTAAIDLPFRVVIFSEDEDVYIGYIDPIWLRRRYALTNCAEILKEYAKLLVRVVNETIRER